MIRKHKNKGTITGFARKDNWLYKRRNLCRCGVDKKECIFCD